MKNFLVFVLLSLVTITFAQESDSNDPIFPYDTCAPPCWLGLIPGVSTSLDVDLALAQHTDIIDPETISKRASLLYYGDYAVDEETGLIQHGGYRFDIMTQPSHILPGLSSRIEIHEGVVDFIVILGTEEHDIQLSDVLEQLGTPDQIRVTYFEYNDQMNLDFIYLDSRIRIYTYPTSEQCQIMTLPDSFSVDRIWYHSERSAKEPIQTYDYDTLQPTLTRFSFESQRNVPLDVWQSWMYGEVDESCFEAWQKLPPPQLETTQDTDSRDVQTESLFTEDTCFAPCWFGLIPGESTNQDLEIMLGENIQNFKGRIDSVSNAYSSEGLIIDGYIQFHWTSNRILSAKYDGVIVVEVKDGIIDSIISTTRVKHNIPDVLSIYGEPDLAFLYESYNIRRLILLYADIPIIVTMDILDNTVSEIDWQAFVATSVRYFRSSNLEAIVESDIFEFI